MPLGDPAHGVDQQQVLGADPGEVDPEGVDPVVVGARGVDGAEVARQAVSVAQRAEQPDRGDEPFLDELRLDALCLDARGRGAWRCSSAVGLRSVTAWGTALRLYGIRPCGCRVVRVGAAAARTADRYARARAGRRAGDRRAVCEWGGPTRMWTPPRGRLYGAGQASGGAAS
ncbi:hypothetical protein SSCG_00751 [Streptomyces clavuligerus]|nr:hypothetical protein SSCG_00751 [Streptomyces clavuligerus]